MNTAEQFLPEIVDRLTREFAPETIFLFGSHAWGLPESDSDLDLLVVVTDSHLPPARRAADAYRCLRDIPCPLDILVKTRQEFERFAGVPASLENRILQEGRRLYG